MPYNPLPNLIKTLAPLLFPNGLPSSNTGPGGVSQSSPSQFSGEAPPTTITDITQLESYVQDQELNNSRNTLLQQAEHISNAIDMNSQVDEIIERNKRTLGLTGGPNGYYDINLVQSASPGQLSNSAVEPDGFRLYLIAPPRPAVSVISAALGNTVQSGGNRLKEQTDNLATSAAGKILPTAALDAAKYVGQKASDVGTAIRKYMDTAGTDFDESFKKYVEQSYKGAKGNSFYSIVLPMPRELTEVHAHNTDSLMLNLMYRAAVGIGIGLGNFGNSLESRFSEQHTRRVTGQGGGLLQNLWQAGTLGLAAPAAELGNYAVDTAKARFGVGLNPNVETIYAAPQPRQFQFTFELYIKSETEAKQVKEFIQTLKQHSYPYSTLGIGGQNQMYIYPGEVYFEFSGKFRNNLFRSLRPCLITNIQVQYSNQEQYQHFEDGSPIVYVVSMTLLENKLLDRNILVDDADEFSEKAFENEEFRRKIKFKDTLLGEKVQDIATNPTRTLNDIGGLIGFPDLGNDFLPPTPPPNQ